MIDVEKLKKQIGEKLRAAREAKEMSQEEIANMLGLSKVGYGALERGKNLIGLQYLLQIPFILNKPLTYFLPGYTINESEKDNPRLDPRFQYIEAMWRFQPEYARDILYNNIKLMETRNPDVRRAMKAAGMDLPPLPDDMSPGTRALFDE